MNYLAHAYLSMRKSGVITGNMISDFVKGKKQFDFPPRVQAGIRIHRQIDAFTDSHESTGFIKSFFRPHYRLYAGVFADVVYDHFLACDLSIFPEAHSIGELTSHTYEDLDRHLGLLPSSFLPVYRSMREHNWLGLYGNEWAVKRSFDGLVKRSLYLSEADIAFGIFQENREVMKKAYEHFFPMLVTFSHSLLTRFLPEE